jgi:hypothetical protein
MQLAIVKEVYKYIAQLFLRSEKPKLAILFRHSENYLNTACKKELMDKKIIIIVVLVLFLASFFVFGMPLLKKVKGKSTGLSLNFGGGETEGGGRPVQVDISVEDICVNVVTGETDEKCLSPTGCESTCKNRGCSFFGLIYNSSELKEKRCFCNCIETSKIKKALNIE